MIERTHFAGNLTILSSVLTFTEQTLEQMSLTNFRVAYLPYSEIKHSDWLKEVTWFETANQSALFQHSSVALLLENVFLHLLLIASCFDEDLGAGPVVDKVYLVQTQ